MVNDAGRPMIIIAAAPSRGHVSPMLQIAKDLVDRDYPVFVTTASAFADRVRATGAEFRPFRGAADFDVDERTPGMRGLPDAPAPGPAVVDYDIAWAFAQPIPDQHDTLQDLFAAAGSRKIVLLHDNAFWGYWPVLLGARGRRAEVVIAIGVTPITISSIDTAPFGPGLPPDATAEGRARNRALNEQVRASLVATPAMLDTVFAGFGVVAPSSVFDAAVMNADRFLELAPSAVEYPRSDLPEHVRFVGALPSPASTGTRPPWWSELEAAKRHGRRVVTMTQGTVSNYDLTELLQPALDALRDRDDLFVVATTGRATSLLGEAPANARVEPFVPFGELFPVTDVFVSNGGYGATLQALALGVPLVLAGASEDKAEVNARLAATGAAIDLRTARPTGSALGEAIDRALDDPELRRAANGLAEEMRRLDPFQSVVNEVESLLAEGSA